MINDFKYIHKFINPNELCEFIIVDWKFITQILPSTVSLYFLLVSVIQINKINLHMWSFFIYLYFINGILKYCTAIDPI